MNDSTSNGFLNKFDREGRDPLGVAVFADHLEEKGHPLAKYVRRSAAYMTHPDSKKIKFHDRGARALYRSAIDRPLPDGSFVSVGDHADLPYPILHIFPPHYGPRFTAPITKAEVEELRELTGVTPTDWSGRLVTNLKKRTDDPDLSQYQLDRDEGPGYQFGPPKHMVKDYTGASLFHHDILDPTGKSVGTIHVVPRGDELHVRWVGMHDAGIDNAKDFVGSVGTAGVRQLRRSLQVHYPEAKLVSGKRVTGAKAKAFGAGGAPGSVKLEREEGESGWSFGPPVEGKPYLLPFRMVPVPTYHHDILDPNGRPRGGAKVSPTHDNDLLVHWIGLHKAGILNAKEFAGAVGPTGVRQLHASLKKHYPQMVRVRGFRATGARMDSVGGGMASVKLEREDEGPGWSFGPPVRDVVTDSLGVPRNIHEILDPQGRSRGAIHVVPLGDKVHVRWVGMHGARVGTARLYSNEIGPVGVRQLSRSLKQHYPGMKSLLGNRVTGARTGRFGLKGAPVVAKLARGDALLQQKPPVAPVADPGPEPKVIYRVLKTGEHVLGLPRSDGTTLIHRAPSFEAAAPVVRDWAKTAEPKHVLALTKAFREAGRQLSARSPRPLVSTQVATRSLQWRPGVEPPMQMARKKPAVGNHWTTRGSDVLAIARGIKDDRDLLGHGVLGDMLQDLGDPLHVVVRRSPKYDRWWSAHAYMQGTPAEGLHAFVTGPNIVATWPDKIVSDPALTIHHKTVRFPRQPAFHLVSATSFAPHPDKEGGIYRRFVAPVTKDELKAIIKYHRKRGHAPAFRDRLQYAIGKAKTEDHEITRGDPMQLARGLDAHPRISGEAQEYHDAHREKFGLDIPLSSPSPKFDPDLSRRTAAAFDRAKHLPNHPRVREAYEALKRETKAQYDFLVSKGVKFSPWNESGQPYRDSEDMTRDARDNRHLYYFPSTSGFGEDRSPPQHPLYEDAPGYSGVKYNDMFRAVHDYFGHAMKGHQFGPRGEFSAWGEHSKMFSPLARLALHTETHGQNSWVNFGPHAHLPVTERPYAEQKATILPRNAVAKLARSEGRLSFAIKDMLSKRQQVRRQIAQQVAGEADLGLDSLHDATSVQPYPRASLVQHISHNDHEVVNYAAAWYGLLAQEPRLSVFHAKSEGQDRLHITRSPLGVSQVLGVAAKLKLPGVVVGPSGLVHVVNPKGQNRARVLALNHMIRGQGHQEIPGELHQLGSSSGASESRHDYREYIKGFQNASNASN